MERSGGRKVITLKLSRLFAHTWTIDPNCFREKTFVALQNMHSMHSQGEEKLIKDESSALQACQ